MYYQLGSKDVLWKFCSGWLSGLRGHNYELMIKQWWDHIVRQGIFRVRTMIAHEGSIWSWETNTCWLSVAHIFNKISNQSTNSQGQYDHQNCPT